MDGQSIFGFNSQHTALKSQIILLLEAIISRSAALTAYLDIHVRYPGVGGVLHQDRTRAGFEIFKYRNGAIQLAPHAA